MSASGEGAVMENCVSTFFCCEISWRLLQCWVKMAAVCPGVDVAAVMDL